MNRLLKNREIFLFLAILLVLVLVKPVEAFAPGLAGLRIAMVLSLLVFGLALGAAMRTGEMAIRGRHVLVLAGLAIWLAFRVPRGGFSRENTSTDPRASRGGTLRRGRVRL